MTNISIRKPVQAIAGDQFVAAWSGYYVVWFRLISGAGSYTMLEFEAKGVKRTFGMYSKFALLEDAAGGAITGYVNNAGSAAEAVAVPGGHPLCWIQVWMEGGEALRSGVGNEVVDVHYVGPNPVTFGGGFCNV